MGLFQEPADFFEPEKQATFASHQLLSGQELTVRLVGHNPLWVSDFQPHRQRLQCSCVSSFLSFYVFFVPSVLVLEGFQETSTCSSIVDRKHHRLQRHHRTVNIPSGWIAAKVQALEIDYQFSSH